MLEKVKSDIRVSYPLSVGNRVMEIFMLLFMVGGLLFNLHWLPSLFNNIFFGMLAVLWVIQYVRFRNNTGVGFVKCCSLQLIVCGLLGAGLASLFNQFLPGGVFQAILIVLVLLAVMAGLNLLCYQEKRTAYYVTFLVYPYCILASDFFLITGFLSVILLMVAFFNGTLAFEHQKMDDDEYFGNSGR